jgi:hypothetical protein
MIRPDFDHIVSNCVVLELNNTPYYCSSPHSLRRPQITVMVHDHMGLNKAKLRYSRYFTCDSGCTFLCNLFYRIRKIFDTFHQTQPHAQYRLMILSYQLIHYDGVKQ